MAFIKKNWVNRIVQFPNRRRLVETEIANVVDVSRYEGTIESEGDTFDADTMNNLEKRIEDAFEEEAQYQAKVIAPTYDVATQYNKGDYAIYERLLYLCLRPTYGEFESSSWKEIDVVNILGDVGTIVDDKVADAQSKTIAPVYNDDTDYNVGDYVLYGNMLYICIQETSGSFDVNAWQVTMVTDTVVTSETVSSIWCGTQEEYDEIDPKNPKTLYFIHDEEEG